jgi:hypothetical protein
MRAGTSSDSFQCLVTKKVRKEFGQLAEVVKRAGMRIE